MNTESFHCSVQIAATDKSRYHRKYILLSLQRFQTTTKLLQLYSSYFLDLDNI